MEIHQIKSCRNAFFTKLYCSTHSISNLCPLSSITKMWTFIPRMVGCIKDSVKATFGVAGDGIASFSRFLRRSGEERIFWTRCTSFRLIDNRFLYCCREFAISILSSKTSMSEEGDGCRKRLWSFVTFSGSKLDDHPSISQGGETRSRVCGMETGKYVCGVSASW